MPFVVVVVVVVDLLLRMYKLSYIFLIKHQNPYSNQEAIAHHSAGSPEDEGYQNVISPISPRDESYTTVAEFLQGQSVRNIEEEEENGCKEDREYYNYIPGGGVGDETYIYMQTGIAGANGNPTSDQDRVRGPLKPNQSVKYINLSKQEQINLRLPGSEYKEPEKTADTGDAEDGEQPIYANYVEDELYTAMS